jgi:hypothetical protein
MKMKEDSKLQKQIIMRKHGEEIITKAQWVVPADFSMFLKCLGMIFLNLQPNWFVLLLPQMLKPTSIIDHATFQIVCPLFSILPLLPLAYRVAVSLVCMVSIIAGK